jgi:hypothetical protein
MIDFLVSIVNFIISLIDNVVSFLTLPTLVFGKIYTFIVQLPYFLILFVICVFFTLFLRMIIGRQS